MIKCEKVCASAHREILDNHKEGRAPMNSMNPVPGTCSAQGSAIAREALNKDGILKSDTFRLDTFDRALSEIENNAGTTHAEKTLAQLRTTVAGEDLSKKSRVVALKVLLNAMTAPLLSPLGFTVAGLLTTVASQVKDSSDRRSILEAGLGQLLQASYTGDNEKTLARIGGQILGTGISSDDAVRVALAVTTALSAPITGPISMAVAALSLEAADKARNSEIKHTIYMAAFDEVLANPRATQEQKELAALGKTLWQITGGHNEMALATGTIAGMLSQTISGPMPHLIAKASLSASAACTDNENRNNILRAGFEAIGGYGQSTPEQKELADLGLTFWQVTSGNDEMAKAIKKVAEVLLQPASGPVVETIAKTSMDAGCACTGIENRHKINRATLERIVSHPRATPEQQITAQFGLDLWQVVTGDTGMAQATGLAIEKLITPITDPFVKVIADISLKVAGKTRNDEAQYRILGKGLERIRMSRSTDQQKALAEYGITIGNQTSGYTPGVQAMEKICALINAPGNGAEWVVIGRAAPEIASAISNPEESRKALHAAFACLMQKSTVPEDVKDFARTALKAANDAPDTQKSTAVLLDYLKQLEDFKTSLQKAEAELVQMKKNLQKPAEGSLIVENDEFVNINGVKLDVKK